MCDWLKSLSRIKSGRLNVWVVLGGALLLMVAVVGLMFTLGKEEPVPFDWRDDWEVKSGFTISQESKEFNFPSSIAFIENGGSGPKDPLYFVTELRGAIKVVTNDRSVFTFAENFFKLKPRSELPSYDGEIGLAGICLAPEQGYVYVTFAYQDDANILRNNVARFQSTPEVFSLQPTGVIDFSDVFSTYESFLSHQIGPCQVDRDFLYVAIGDGNQPPKSQQPDVLLGKVIRMTLDGDPDDQNPFYQDNDHSRGENFVYALGLRNPFGMDVVYGDVFVADNGTQDDRFISLESGANYLWDGSNASSGANASAVLTPGKGVAQMERYPAEASLFPRVFQDNFFLTVTGAGDRPVEFGVPAIWTIPFDVEVGRVTNAPEPFARYLGQTIQIVAALAWGPDGLYFAPLLPDQSGDTAIFKISYNPFLEHPHIIETELDPLVVMKAYGCSACHKIGDSPGGTRGPNLEREALVTRIEDRLHSDEYKEVLEEVSGLDREPFNRYKEARQKIADAGGIDKVRLWIETRLLEPRFDNPGALMPVLGLSRPEAASVARFLTGVEPPKESKGFFRRVTDVGALGDRLEERLPRATRLNARNFLVSFFIVGFGLGCVLSVGGILGVQWYRRRRRL